MRSLSKDEIKLLESQQCVCDDWEQIMVADNFSTANISRVRFSGNILLGAFNKTFELPSGIEKHSGIYNATLHNCVIEDDVYISKINNHIANYHIKKGCYIENVNQLVTEGHAFFGNGTEVSVLNEGGGREVKIFNTLSSHLAYILALYRYRPQLIEQINKLIAEYTTRQSSTMGTVGCNSRLINCGNIINVAIGENASVCGTPLLKNGTINSTPQNPTVVGNDVIARDFIIGCGSEVNDGALLDKCFVGESCQIAKQFSAVDSLFFSNCQLFHGESTAVFAGPFTTTHHKSTLLIGCMFSFFNAGSGTNQSNHMYKLGPVHQGIFERGVKTGSDSYIMLEAQAGAFSLVMGHHDSHFDTADLPFSYLIEEAGKTMLIPAVNFQTVGTQRDSQKWPKRDKRKGNKHTDYIIFDLLNPYTVLKIKKGIEVLTSLNEKSAEVYNYKNVKIRSLFAVKGLKIYQTAINYYLGQKLAEKFKSGINLSSLQFTHNIDDKNWVDLSGLIIPQSLLNNFLSQVEQGLIKEIEEFNSFFNSFYNDYATYEWNFVLHLLSEQLQKSVNAITVADIENLMKMCQKDIKSVTDAIIADAKKEFGATSMIGFGADGNKDDQLTDFENVRGTVNENAYIQELIKSNGMV